jgi:hypothetical protein
VLVAAVFGEVHSAASEGFAQALGIVTVIGMVVQWSPQIWTTYKAKV